ncbi:hypothetical protein Hdeb2414_s0020g00561191 [Helianthus debilis subsp. tardiflorus]
MDPSHNHNNHHQCLEVSPHCPQHGRYPHHHLQLSPNCPLHGHLLPPCPSHFHPIPLPHNPKVNPPIPPPEADADSKSQLLMMQDGNEQYEDEFIYVLTDEWKDFFAKSEAKRKLAKKQAKKKGKD